MSNPGPVKRKYSINCRNSSASACFREAEKLGLYHTPGIVMVFFDTETTGVDGRKDPLTNEKILDEPTEVSAHKYLVEPDLGLRLVDNIEIYVKPSIPVPQDVEELTGITNEMLADKPSWAEVHKKIRDFFGHYIVVAHNAPFDVKMMTRMYERCGDTFEPADVIDTCAAARYMFPDAESKKLDKLIEFLQLQSRVDYLSKGELDYHNSSYDIIAMRVLYEAMRNNLETRFQGRRLIPYIEYAYYWAGHNHCQTATVFKTSSGKIEFNHYSSSWMSDEVDLSIVDMKKFEENALKYTGSADLKEMKKFRKLGANTFDA